MNLQTIMILFLCAGCASYPKATFSRIEKNKEIHNNDRFLKKDKVELCSAAPIIYPFWAKTKVDILFDKICANGNTVKNVVYSEKIIFGFLYNQVCSVLEGDCYE